VAGDARLVRHGIMGTMTDLAERGERFKALHAGAPFVIPNPWDLGSAKLLASLGFEALATTSSGFAFTLGRPDGGVSRDEVLEHVHALSEATPLPVSADLENGYGAGPEDAAAAIAGAAGAGAVGGSIEDYDPEGHIYCLEHAEARVAAAAEAAAGVGFAFTLTARAENHIRGNPDLEDTIARLQAYERAGADVLYAPGLTAEQVRAVKAETSAPLNVLGLAGMSFADLFDAGAQRVSVGGGLAWVGVAAVRAAAEELRAGGDMRPPETRLRLREMLGD
jgi:2-methylisocitrate lyase-like PEP mutase family enzyme